MVPPAVAPAVGVSRALVGAYRVQEMVPYVGSVVPGPGGDAPRSNVVPEGIGTLRAIVPEFLPARHHAPSPHRPQTACPESMCC